MENRTVKNETKPETGRPEAAPQARVQPRTGARVVVTDRRGYGSALIYGTQQANGRYIIMGDADDSYDFLHLMPFVEKLREGYDLVKKLKRLDSATADTVKYHLGIVGADVTVVFPHDALELLKMSSLFQKIGDNGLSMKIIRAYDSCSQMAISVDRHIAERNAQPADSLYNWIELHDPRVFADPADIDKAITAINVYLRR